jgi:hypothetical protein
VTDERDQKICHLDLFEGTIQEPVLETAGEKPSGETMPWPIFKPDSSKTRVSIDTA